MHKAAKEHLEEYLRGAIKGGASVEFHSHLAACEACRSEVETMTAQASLLRSLAAQEEIVAAPGFCARVLSAVEARRQAPLAYAFLDPSFFHRLAYGFLTAAVLLGSYLVYTAQTPAFQAPSPMSFLAGGPPDDPHVGYDTQRDRETVLLSLASYQE